ncbi:MAG: class I tRNA ligase family protein [Candidatus Harrisonbacteria bacterium]|nr:class I tRNA ligase family protein [Candidatus Harrisonbacteria bacterium]
MLNLLKSFNLPQIEEKILKFWKEGRVFERIQELRKKSKKAKPFKFFEGPPTANGRPGIHHVLARSFKDVIPRYKTMRGFFVLRRAGWDTHGLPVELEVEKKLGIKTKQEIEKFGIVEFNTQAKMSVWAYKSDWEKLTERIGFWLDFNDPYITYNNPYIESLWWIFSEIERRGHLKKLHKIVPWCPRCQTPLSSHELGQPGAYRTTKDPSVYIKLKIKNSKTNDCLLIWTTTPWTLPGNVAVAVNPKLTYTKYKVGGEYLWSYNVPPKTEKGEPEVVEKLSGKKLAGLEYEPPYPNEGAHKVIEADFVSTEEGTGLVHIAPAYGEDDLRVAGHGPIPMSVDDRGIMKKSASWRIPGEGKFVKEADSDIIADLEKRKILHSSGLIEHEYPFCWRCSTPLLYFARKSWFIVMSKLRSEMLSANKKINWIPEHIKEGRFGEWLRDLKDWSISRNRYWGTPLPIWECEKDETHRLFIGSLEDLNKHAFNKNRFFIARHSEAEHNISGTLANGSESGNNASKLTEKGVKQAESMAKEFTKKKIDVIYHSPLARTKEVAQIIAKATGAETIADKRLTEVNGGSFNNRSVGEFGAFFKSKMERFSKTPPGGENYSDIKKRMLEAIRDINQKHNEKNILIVSHGDPLFVLEGAVQGLSNEKISEISSLPVAGWKEISSNNWPLNKDGELDLHRPFIDAVCLQCPDCEAKMNRVKDVADAWFDSGAMPFAQWHYPFENKQLIDKGEQFPADYITEGIDQTRGWFYTLLAVSILLKRGAPYKNVISLGLLLDKHGQKMSKSKGNIVDPWEMINKYGADVLRWYFFTINPPGEPKRFDENDLRKTVNKLFMIIYNSFVFYKTYGEGSSEPIPALDNWVLARLQETIAQVTEAMDKYEIGDAAKSIERLVDDFSRWYIRRSRKNVSGQTLNKVLSMLSKLIAPLTPFFADALWQSLGNRESVHSADWPEVEKKLFDKKLLGAMAEVRKLASLALAEREKAGIKVRQPLRELRIKNQELKKSDKSLLDILADEVNVKTVSFDDKITAEIELDLKITPELKNEGILRDLIRMVQGLRHDAGYQPHNKIALMAELPSDIFKVAQANLAEFKKAVNAQEVEFKRDKFDAEISTNLDGQKIWLAVRKV